MRGGGQTSSFRGVPLNEVIILGVLGTEQFAVSHMFHVFEEHYQTCQILGRRFFILCGRFFPLVPKHPMFLFPPPLSSQESIYANSPGYSTDLLLSCKGHKISQIKWVLSFSVLQFKLFSPFLLSKLKLFLFIVQFLGHFCMYLVTDKGESKF